MTRTPAVKKTGTAFRQICKKEAVEVKSEVGQETQTGVMELRATDRGLPVEAFLS
jgi:hypothetical protein